MCPSRNTEWLCTQCYSTKPTSTKNVNTKKSSLSNMGKIIEKTSKWKRNIKELYFRAYSTTETNSGAGMPRGYSLKENWFR